MTRLIVIAGAGEYPRLLVEGALPGLLEGAAHREGPSRHNNHLQTDIAFKGGFVLGINVQRKEGQQKTHSQHHTQNRP